MDQFFPFLGPWFWFVAAGVLLVLELAAPGVFFIWLAAAALLTGLVDLAVPMGWQGEALVFAVLSLAAIFVGRPILKRRHALDSDQPNLNRRMFDYVGKSYVLKDAIVNGQGKVRIDDTLWDVLGPDLPAGSAVKVTGVTGLRLTVVPGEMESSTRH
jgi:membrane protein implicated in regulation of membrane protease activity